MKKLITLFALLAGVSSPAWAERSDMLSELQRTTITRAIAQEMVEKNVINWRVGERAQYRIKAVIGELGKLNKWVDRDEGTALWLISEITGQQAQKTEAKIDRATGQILEYIENGVRKDPPQQDVEIISQDEQRVTVPAGSFDSIHVVLKVNNNPQVRKVEVWINPRDVVMDGSIKTKVETSFMPIEIEMLSMTRP